MNFEGPVPVKKLFRCYKGMFDLKPIKFLITEALGACMGTCSFEETLTCMKHFLPNDHIVSSILYFLHILFLVALDYCSYSLWDWRKVLVLPGS